MKLTVKTLKGSHFEIRVQPTDTIMAVKKNIEDVQGKDNYPCGQQLLIHNGKVLKDKSTLAENKVSEDGFLVVMLSKSKTLGSSGTSSTQPGSTTQPISNPTSAREAPVQAPAPEITSSGSNVATANAPSDTYGQAASILVAGSNLEQTIQQIMDIGGGNWDKEIVTRALRAAYNNPERAVDSLYSGIPEAAEVAVPVAHLPVNQATSEGAETRFYRIKSPGDQWSMVDSRWAKLIGLLRDHSLKSPSIVYFLVVQLVAALVAVFEVYGSRFGLDLYRNLCVGHLLSSFEHIVWVLCCLLLPAVQLVVGSSHPSWVSLPFFICSCIGLIDWSLTSNFLGLFRYLLLYAGLNIVLLYVYQLPGEFSCMFQWHADFIGLYKISAKSNWSEICSGVSLLLFYFV
ncbi:unnamed protein product [Camellia sinensis]